MAKKIKSLADAKIKAELVQAKADNKALISSLVEAEARAGLVETLQFSARRRPIRVRSQKPVKRDKRLAAAVCLFSDWHVGEAVTKAATNGRNEYTPTIAAARARKLAESVVWMIQHHRTSFQIDQLVMWPGGDLITGFLHPDQIQSNHIPPNQEILLVQELLCEAIDLALGAGLEVVLPCSYGNHGRTTIKPQIATGAANSYEWLLYHQIRRMYAKEPRVKFQIPDGEFNYLRVYDTTIRFTHGDATKYQGGIGGMTVPILKAIARWQTYQHADITCMGHYHQYLDTPGLVVNGSLIGAAPYGMRVGSYEAPAQAFFLIDSKRGKCQSTPLWVT